jgi:hypothetical protein
MPGDKTAAAAASFLSACCCWVSWITEGESEMNTCCTQGKQLREAFNWSCRMLLVCAQRQLLQHHHHHLDEKAFKLHRQNQMSMSKHQNSKNNFLDVHDDDE